jgi:hypothetical protein
MLYCPFRARQRKERDSRTQAAGLGCARSPRWGSSWQEWQLEPPMSSKRCGTCADPGGRAACSLQDSASSGPSELCTNCQPKRPLIQRFPLVMSWSSGEVTLTILLS